MAGVVRMQLRADRRLTAPKKAEYKWWPDGYEPLYYVVTPRVGAMAWHIDNGL